MTDMVSQVVQVLDDGNQFMSPSRVLHSRVKKLQPRRKPIPLSKTTGELDTFEKQKERERKDIKRLRPTAKLKYNDSRRKWDVKAQDRLQQKEMIQITHNTLLNEITIRTGAIGLYLATIKKWASTVDSLTGRMKSLASSLDTTDTPQKKQKIESELWSIDSEISKALRKMIIYGSLISAAGGLGADRAYKEIKKLTKQRRK